MHPSLDPTYAPKYAVYGLGVSGLAAMAFFKSRGIDACCWDDNAAKRRDASDSSYLIWDFAHNSFPQSVTRLIISPGIPWNGQDPSHAGFKIAEKAKRRNIEIISDVECLFVNAPTFHPALIHPDAARFAVTGTNGKTSVVTWLEKMIQLQGFRAEALGNNGVAALQSHHNKDALIFELSSYQLDLAHRKVFDRVMLLNISPDHLERYGTVEAYAESKSRIIDLLKQDGTGLVIGVDDAYCAEIAKQATQNGVDVLRFSTQHALAGGIYLDDGRLIDHRGEVPLVILDPTADPMLNNLQHMRNLVAVYAFMCRYSVENFHQLATNAVREMDFDHRQNPVAFAENILFIDDSKATNPIAAADALRQFRQIHWVAGGKAKDGGFDDLKNCFDDVQAIYLIGDAQDELAKYLHVQPLPQGTIIYLCDNLANTMQQLTVNLAKQDSPVTVLFSPGCASFDQFDNYVARGKAFQALVQQHGGVPIAVHDLALDADISSDPAIGLIDQLRRKLQDEDTKAAVPAPPSQLLTRPSRKKKKQETGSDRILTFVADWLAQVDKVSILAILMLFSFGLLVQSIAEVHIHDISFTKQAMIGLIGIVGMFTLSMMPRRVVLPLMGFVFLIMLSVMASVPFLGIEIKGGTRWISIPIVNFSIQPVEIFKVSAISFFAIIQGYACNMGYSKLMRNGISVVFITTAVTLILIQPDFSQSVLMLASLLIIALLVAELSVWSVLIAGLAVLPSVFWLAYSLFDHVKQRADDFWYNDYDASDQVALAKLTALRAEWFSGHIDENIGAWYSMSDVESDFVFVLMMQEFGKFWSLFPLLLILILVYRALSRTWLVQDITLRFWLWGLSVMISAQTFINVATSTGISPPTGMTLPLVSYGGSSLMGIFFAFGLILFMSRDDVRHE